MDFIKAHFPDAIVETEILTSKGALYLPTGEEPPSQPFLISLHRALPPEDYDLDRIRPYFNGGCEETCVKFSRCNGFSFSYYFTAYGILIDGAYAGGGLSFYNVPYDLAGQSYRSYPKYAPSNGYFVSTLQTPENDEELCDVIDAHGRIVAGYFRKSTEVLETFDSLVAWISRRVPQALAFLGL